MVALFIPVYERPHYLRQTLDSVIHAIDEDVTVFLIDDGSKDPVIEQMCNKFFDNAQCHGFYYRFPHAGVAMNMKRGMELCKKFETIITLDSDFEVKNHFIKSLSDLLKAHYTIDTIVTGFNAHTHPIKARGDGYAVKESIGGGNLCFTSETYEKHIKPILTNNLWDWNLCGVMKQAGGRFLCTIPSVVQHIGVKSTLDHPNADVAIDY